VMIEVPVRLSLLLVLAFCAGFSIGAGLNVVATTLIVVATYDKLIQLIWLGKQPPSLPRHPPDDPAG